VPFQAIGAYPDLCNTIVAVDLLAIQLSVDTDHAEALLRVVSCNVCDFVEVAVHARNFSLDLCKVLIAQERSM
jgi:hypothetical protein